jgi:Shikimate 5-dehydrogenase
MYRFGLIGNPISHSLSPALFKAAYGMENYSYELIETSDLLQSLHILKEEGFNGANITMPYKEQIMPYIQYPDKISNILGCANVVLNKNNSLYSYNTDYDGVKETILPYININDNNTVLIVGLGGAGMAATLACTDIGLNVIIANRNVQKAENFVNKIKSNTNHNQINILTISLDEIEIHISNCSIIIYALPILISQLLPITLKNKIVLEANYANPFLANYNFEYNYISGKYWLYYQAITAFKLFTNITPNITKMKKIIGIQR